MQPQDDPGCNVRVLLESTATPFTVANYPPRATIYLQGAPCNRVMYIEEGRVWLAVTARRGKEVIGDLLGTGAFLGEEALAGLAERRQTAIAFTATQVLVVTKGHMIQLLRTQPKLLNRLVTHLFARNTRLEANLTDLLLNSSEQRLAHTLLALADCDERHPCRCTLPDIPQAIIAEMVGTTRSRVNLFMGRLKKRGFLEEKSGVLHVNAALLESAQLPERSGLSAGW